MVLDSRSGKHQAPSSAWITVERRRAIYNRDNWMCAYCWMNISDVDAQLRTLDHLVSSEEYDMLPNYCGNVAHRGTAIEPCCQTFFGSKHKTTNLVTACKPCNGARQSLAWETFANRFAGATARILNVINDVRPIDIKTAKLEVATLKAAKGEKFIARKSYANCWKTAQRLSQGIGTK
jgi:hypothetical protein